MTSETFRVVAEWCKSATRFRVCQPEAGAVRRCVLRPEEIRTQGAVLPGKVTDVVTNSVRVTSRSMIMRGLWRGVVDAGVILGLWAHFPTWLVGFAFRGRWGAGA